MKARAHMGSWCRMIIALLQLRKESLKKIQGFTGFEPLTSPIPVPRSKPTGSRSLWLIHWYEILSIHDKKELRCTSKAQFSVITWHQSTVLTIYVLTIYSARSWFRLLTVLYTLVKAQEAQFLTACLFADCFQSVSIGHETGVSRHPEALYGMVANLQNNFEAKHFNLKSLVADLFVSLVWWQFLNSTTLSQKRIQGCQLREGMIDDVIMFDKWHHLCKKYSLTPIMPQNARKRCWFDLTRLLPTNHMHYCIYCNGISEFLRKRLMLTVK